MRAVTSECPRRVPADKAMRCLALLRGSDYTEPRLWRLRNWRKRRGLSQVELARRLKSSQSRIAKMEAGDTSVSVDLLVRALFAIGAKPKDLAKTIRQFEDKVTV